MSNKQRSGQSGFVVLLVVIAVIILAAALFGALALNKDKAKKAATNNVSTATSSSQISESRRLSQNLDRKNDAQRIAGAVTEFMNNNVGTLPSGWQDGQIVGHEGTAPSSVQLVHYAKIFFVDASTFNQSATLTNDNIRVVIHATCNQDGSASASSSNQAYVVQYSQALSQGGDAFEGKCMEG